MGEIKPYTPVMPIVAVFSRYDEAFNWVKEKLKEKWGEISLTSKRFLFSSFTDYYQQSMGEDLYKELYAFDSLVSPDFLTDAKIYTNLLEREFKKVYDLPEIRPVNIDPGYLSHLKFTLASTKDAPHRLAAGKGIFQEVTLHYNHGEWRPFEWTYPDYRLEETAHFLSECRKHYMHLLKETAI